MYIVKRILRAIPGRIKRFFKPYKIIKIPAGNAKLFINSEAAKVYLSFWKNYIYDFERFIKYSSTLKVQGDQLNLKSRIVAKYHVIEKGLSLKETRIGFGTKVVNSLVEHVDLYIKKGYPLNDEQFISAIKVLQAYCQYHECHNHDVSLIKNRIEKYLGHLNNSERISGGTNVLTKSDILSLINKGFEGLASSRRSIRNFTDEKISLQDIKNAIRIAQHTPSVCNRQTSRVYIVQDKTLIKKILNCQNGNRGFGHLADKILVVSSNLRVMNGISERNQVFIDGGMFGMSLIYALHAKGIGTCTLNWSAPYERDLALRNILPIKEEEVVIFLIAIGGIPEKLNVANSHREPLENVAQVF